MIKSIVSALTFYAALSSGDSSRRLLQAQFPAVQPPAPAPAPATPVQPVAPVNPVAPVVPVVMVRVSMGGLALSLVVCDTKSRALFKDFIDHLYGLDCQGHPPARHLQTLREHQ